jgi:hypothetical protein
LVGLPVVVAVAGLMSASPVRPAQSDLDSLVLFDSMIVVETTSGSQVMTDRSVDALAQLAELATRAHPVGSAEHQARVRALIEAQRHHRNQPGGYWVAAAKSAAHIRRLRSLLDALVGYGYRTWLVGVGCWDSGWWSIRPRPPHPGARQPR